MEHSLEGARVLSYSVDFEGRRLRLRLLTQSDKPRSVCFSGLLGHWFEDAGPQNRITDIAPVTIEYFFTYYSAFLKRTMEFGFPPCDDLEQLRARMERDRLRCFVLEAAQGLCGFILAERARL